MPTKMSVAEIEFSTWTSITTVGTEEEFIQLEI